MLTAQEIIAFFSAVSALATIALVVVAWFQLKNIAVVQRKWATLHVCERYDTDPVPEQATQTIWDRRLGPGDYSNQAEYEREVIVLLNYLDSLAIGIDQNLYVEEIIRDHVESVVKLAVEAFLLSPQAVAKRQYFPTLIALHNAWSRPERHFRDGR